MTPKSPKPRIAVIGVGLMGSAIASRLLECGHPVHLYDREASKAEALRHLGGLPFESASQACQGVEFAITSLNSAAIVRKAVFGDAGVAESVARDALLIDMSSIDPGSTASMASELRAKRGVGWVDAPLSGGVPKALTGQLTVMAGGSVEDVSRACEVMESLCQRFTHMGPCGAGQTTKLVNQLLCAIQFQAVAEAVRLAETGGVNAVRLAEALQGGRADSQILQEFGEKMALRDESPTGRIDNMLKDLEALQAFSQERRLPLPLASHVAELHRTFIAAGLGSLDTVATMRQFTGYQPA